MSSSQSTLKKGLWSDNWHRRRVSARQSTSKQGCAGFRASKDVKAGLWSVTAGFRASKDVKSGLWSVTKHGGRVAARQSTSNQGFINVRVHMLGVLLGVGLVLGRST